MVHAPSTNGSSPVKDKKGERHRQNGNLSQSPLLFEVAWEVCNQIGGIYTVLKTKTPAMLDRWGDDYYLIGPYEPQHAAIEFEEAASSKKEIRTTLSRLGQAGIKCYFGRWLIPGRPKVILLDYRPRFLSLDKDKYLLWKDHGIPTEQGDADLNNAIAFGFTVCEFFRELCQEKKGRAIIAHFHEWLASVALPRIRKMNLPLATVFTTHATLLGRYIASNNWNFYQDLQYINPEQSASDYNIQSRYSLERAAAHCAHVFTTISDVTGQEAQHLLRRRPDVITPNGHNVHRFTALHEFQNLHVKFKERIHEFVRGHFFPTYQFDIDRTLYFFTSGRYEFRNKGIDLFIEALHRLNQRLRHVPHAPTVVAFIVTRAHTKNINVDALQRHLMFEDLKNICSEIQSGTGHRIMDAVAKGHFPSYEEVLPPEYQVRLKRALFARRSSRLPGIVTHDLVHDGTDAILQHLRHRQLLNAQSDPVKVVFHPDFITSTSPLFNLDYDQFVRGCHMGIFPSYYEPWGYTPLECIALGVPTVTTDLSGFGAYVQKNIPDSREDGVYVLNRASQSPDQSIEELTNHLFNFVQLSRRERIEQRNRVERLTELFDWSLMAEQYHKAHVEVLKRIGAHSVMLKSPSGAVSQERV